MRIIEDERFEEAQKKYEDNELETTIIDAEDGYNGLPSHKEAVIFYFENYIGSAP